MKVLIHKSDHLGDFALALPALWEVRQKFGVQAEIHILVREFNLEWQQILPWLGQLHPLRHPRYERQGDVPKMMLSLQALKTAYALRERDFDWGIDLISTRNDLLAKWLLLAAGCHRSSGPDGSYSFLLSEAHPEPQVHQTELLAARFPASWGIQGTSKPEIFIPENYRWNGGIRQEILLAPFAGTPAKSWPESYWLQLADQLSRDWKVRILVPEPELQLHREFLSGFAEEQWSVVSSIRQTLDALRNAKALVALDTAVAHFAWVTGTPFVQIFSGTAEASRWAPKSGGITLQQEPECFPCRSEICLQNTHKCMEQIQVQDVLDKMNEVVG